MALDTSTPFTWGAGGEAITPTQVSSRRKIIEAMMARGNDFSPVQSWTQGAARVANAAFGAMAARDLDKEEKAARDASVARQATWFDGGGTAPATEAGATPLAAAAKGAAVGGFDAAVSRTLGFEGGLNPKDTNGTPSARGINQAANPDVDMNRAMNDPNYTRGIYKTRYWDAISGDQLAAQNPALAHVAFDTAVIAGPGRAKELLAQAGGDPLKLLDLREAFQNRLLAADRAKYGPYEKAWANRVAGLRADVGYAGKLGASGPVVPPQAAPVRVAQADTDVAADALPFAAAGTTPSPISAPGGSSVPSMVGTPLPGRPDPISPGAKGVVGTPNATRDTSSSGRSVVTDALSTRAPGSAGGLNSRALMGTMNDPWATDSEKRVAAALLERSMQPQTYNYQTDAAGNVVQMDPRGVQPPRVVYTSPPKPTDREAQARAAGLQPGTPEYRNFQIYGDPRGEDPGKDVEVKEINGRLVTVDKRKGAATDVTPQGMPAGFRPMTPEERKQYEVPEGLPAGMGPDGKPQYGPAKAVTTVNATPGPSAKVFEEVSNRADAARAAATALPAFSEAKSALDSGKIVLGAGADMRLGLQKIAALFGMDPSSAENAEVFRSSMAPVVFATVKGLGSGSGISNNDLKFAEKAAAGDITLEPGSIRRLIDIGVRAAQARIKAHNEMLDRVYPASDEQNRQVRALFAVDAQPMAAPAGPAAAPVPQAPPVATAPAPQPGPTAAGALKPASPDVLAKARDAIARGADSNAVRQRIRDAGFDPAGL